MADVHLSEEGLASLTKLLKELQLGLDDIHDQEAENTKKEFAEKLKNATTLEDFKKAADEREASRHRASIASEAKAKLDAAEEEYNKRLAFLNNISEETVKLIREQGREDLITIKDSAKEEELKRQKQKAYQEAERQKTQKENGELKQTKDPWGNIKNLKTIIKSFTNGVDKVDENGNVVKNADGTVQKDIAATLKNGFSNIYKGFDNVVDGIATMASKLDGQIDSIAGLKGSIDTRLQGSKNATAEGSYWDRITKDVTSIAAVSPLVKQETINSKISALVDKGISFDVEQRAFLLSISGKIATTFENNASALNKLVRIQQQDSTAARLGMESALTSFLNNMYETTEYMSEIMSSINSKLYEAEALMDTEEATAFEYQVNKWLGSMYSVGMSDSGVSAISTALSDLAAGKISGISGNSTGNLLVMAANQAGLSISDLLANGLNDETTNQLMEAMVDYLSKIYRQAGDSKVIQQQVASIYGLTASDLKAMLNLTTDTTTMGTIANSYLTYDNAITQLNYMASTMYDRTSIGEQVQNLTSNIQYSMASSIASNPAMYATYKLAKLAEEMFGGISIPDVTVVGSGAALNTNVADMLMATALGGSMLGNISNIISGIGNSFSANSMLSALGIGNGVQSVVRGSGTGLITTGGATTSQSTAMYSSEGGAYDKAMSSASQQTAEAVAGTDESETDTKNKVIDEHIVAISELLEAVINGSSKFHVITTEEPESSLT